MIEKTMEVDRMEDVISVFGSFDQNLRMIETEYNVRVTDRDEQIHITGEAENVLYAEKAIAGLLSLAGQGRGDRRAERALHLPSRARGPGAEDPGTCGRRGVHHGQGQAHQGQDPGAEEVYRGHSEKCSYAGDRPGRHR